jgi:predicted RNA-binding protein YlxR (DUF448 family)
MLAIEDVTKAVGLERDPDPIGLDMGPGRSGGPKDRTVSRMCALTRQSRPAADLLRFVLTPAGSVVVDLKHKLPGRGLWLSISRETLDQAVRKGIFQKGFKRPIDGLSTLAAETEALMVRGVCDALSIAAKAGEVVSGAGKVADLVESGQSIALIHAADGAFDGIRKLNALIGQQNIRVIRVLNSDELDLALGRSNVIHAALRAGPASKTFLSRCQTLEGFRGTNGVDGTIQE